MPTILDEIAEATRERVAKAKREEGLASVRRRAEEAAAAEVADMSGEFAYPFLQALEAPGMSFICEAKKASPSKGVIAEDFPYVQIAREYEAAGASAISCLTEPQWFLGSNDYLREIAQAVSIPVLRKDFTVDEYMVWEAKCLGAEAVLLICAMLSDAQLSEYHDAATSVGLSVLVEAHDEDEIARALDAGARIVGVNNRDLRDFTVDVGRAGRMRALIPEGIVYVSESGIAGAQDVARCAESGADAVLVGEALMRSADKRTTLDEFRAAAQEASAECARLAADEADGAKGAEGADEADGAKGAECAADAKAATSRESRS